MKYTSKLILNWTEYEFGAGGWGWWQPWANTVLYYDFEHTSWTTETDLAWNYNGTYQNGSPTIWTLASWKKYFDTEWTNCLNTNNTLSTLNYDNSTVCLWFNLQAGNKSFFGQERWWVQWWTIFGENYNWNNSFCLGSDSNSRSVASSTDTWYNVVIVNDGIKTTLYSNWQQVSQKNMTSSIWNKYFHVGWAANYSPTSPQTVPSNNIWDTFFGSIIIENKARTAQEVSDYYDLTKSLYGIS